MCPALRRWKNTEILQFNIDGKLDSWSETRDDNEKPKSEQKKAVGV